METLVSIFGFITVVLVLGLLLSIPLHVLKHAISWMQHRVQPGKLEEKEVAFLEKHFEYYNRLPDKSKELFRKRVANFKSMKEFVPRNMIEVSWEMKLLISACAIQLIFGFPSVNLSFFSNILVYPTAYYNASTKNHHQGEVNPKYRAIVLSWKHFVKGYLKADDGRNLGLHEMAHALRLENRIQNNEYNFLNKSVLRNWERFAISTMAEIKSGQEDFFREYGSVNREEFFSVAVENFFERPEMFNGKHPHLYQSLCRLLKQDPLLLRS